MQQAYQHFISSIMECLIKLDQSLVSVPISHKITTFYKEEKLYSSNKFVTGHRVASTTVNQLPNEFTHQSVSRTININFSHLLFSSTKCETMFPSSVLRAKSRTAPGE